MTDGPNSPLDPPPSRPKEPTRKSGPLDHTAPVHRPPVSRPPIRRQANEWTQEDEDRYQAERSRAASRAHTRRRQAWSFFAIVGAVVLIGLLGAAINQGMISMPFGSKNEVPCPATPAALKPSDIQVRVLNGTSRAGLAKSVGTEVSSRGFKVIGTENAPDEIRGFSEPVLVVYGEGSDREAKAVAALVSKAKLTKDTRTNGNIDLVLGDSYSALAPAAQAKKALQPTPVKSPEGCTPVKTTVSS